MQMKPNSLHRIATPHSESNFTVCQLDYVNKTGGFMRLLAYSSLMILITASLGCSTQDRANQGAVANKAAAATESATSVSEAEIAHVVQTANQSEIEAAQLAKTKSKNKEVLSFANHMIDDHTKMDKQNMELAQKLNVQPDTNAVSTSMKTGATATMSSLKDLKGKEFDKAYIDQQVTMHKSVLENFDNTLIPNANTPELKDMLTAARSSIETHLQHATELQKKLTR
jgi:putative membrane protein